jgi:small GTP-binding protein
MSYDYLYKLVLIGDENVGKTSYADKLLSDVFFDVYRPTLGVDFYTKKLTLHDNIVIKTHMWDTAGHEKFYPIIKSYFLGIAGAIIFFDITKRKTFDNVINWVTRLKECNRDVFPILLLGTKSDKCKNREVDDGEAMEYAKQNDMIYYEISAKDNSNIINSFHELVRKIFSRMDVNNLGPGIQRHFSQDNDRECNIKLNKECKYRCCNII